MPGEPPEDGEMSQMTLQMTGLRASMLPLGNGGSHNTEFYEWMRKILDL